MKILPEKGGNHIVRQPLVPSHGSAQKLKNLPGGLSDDSVVKNPSVNAGDTGSIPALGGSHMPWSSKVRTPRLLKPCSRAQEPQLLKPLYLESVLRNKRSRCNERPTNHSSRVAPAPGLPQLEKSSLSNETLAKPKINLKSYFLKICHGSESERL